MLLAATQSAGSLLQARLQHRKIVEGVARDGAQLASPDEGSTEQIFLHCEFAEYHATLRNVGDAPPCSKMIGQRSNLCLVKDDLAGKARQDADKAA